LHSQGPDQERQVQWTWIGPGLTLVAYGWYFLADLGGLGYLVIGLGVLVATAGNRAIGLLDAWAEQRGDRQDDEAGGEAPEVLLRGAWNRFWLALILMAGLGAFSLWRVQMTVWRPVSERYYFFAADNWLGRLEHSWFNDALYAFGMVGILYVLYALKGFLGGWFGQSSRVSLGEADQALTLDEWEDHQERSKLMIGTGIVLILIWAWLEEIGDLVPGYIFDKWDLNAIYVGFVLGYSMMRHLPYPDFSARPPFPAKPVVGTPWLEDGSRAVYVGFVWVYTSVTDPTTYGDRWSHMAELSAIILGSMWLIDLGRRPRTRVSTIELSGS